MPPAPLPPPDTWLDIALGAGAIAGVVGVGVGGVIAYAYGRRASASISAEAHTTGDRVILAARPVVKAVGIFAVAFHESQGAVVRVTEVYIDADGTLQDGRFWEADGVFGQQQVDPGEELTTTVVFPLPLPSASVVGWRISLGIRAPTRRGLPRASAAWADRIFVARPDSESIDL